MVRNREEITRTIGILLLENRVVRYFQIIFDVRIDFVKLLVRLTIIAIVLLLCGTYDHGFTQFFVQKGNKR